MKYCQLGNGSLQVSRIGFGCAPLGGYDYGAVDDTTSIAAVREALDAGITFFDVADVYGLGRAERVLGQALKGRRLDAIVATKGGVAFTDHGTTRRTLAPEHLSKAIDASLRRLDIDVIDLYQLHWPDGTTPISDAVGAVSRAVEAGKVREIGVCNFSIEQVADAQAVAPIVSLQLPRSLLEGQSKQTIEHCHRVWGVGAVCYNALAQGLLTGKYPAAGAPVFADLRSRSGLFDPARRDAVTQIVERLRRAADRTGLTVGQAALQWLLAQRGVQVVLTGIKTPLQARENARAGDGHLTLPEITNLSEVACLT